MSTQIAPLEAQSCLKELQSVRQLLGRIEIRLADAIHDPCKIVNGRNRVTAIQHFCCERFGVSKEALTGKTRTELVVWARHVAVYLSRRFTDLNVVALGVAFKRDHTSMCHALKSVENRTSYDEGARAQVATMTTELEELFGRETPQPSTLNPQPLPS